MNYQMNYYNYESELDQIERLGRDLAQKDSLLKSSKGVREMHDKLQTMEKRTHKKEVFISSYPFSKTVLNKFERKVSQFDKEEIKRTSYDKAYKKEIKKYRLSTIFISIIIPLIGLYFLMRIPSKIENWISTWIITQPIEIGVISFISLLLFFGAFWFLSWSYANDLIIRRIPTTILVFVAAVIILVFEIIGNYETFEAIEQSFNHFLGLLAVLFVSFGFHLPIIVFSVLYNYCYKITDKIIQKIYSKAIEKKVNNFVAKEYEEWLLNKVSIESEEYVEAVEIDKILEPYFNKDTEKFNEVMNELYEIYVKDIENYNEQLKSNNKELINIYSETINKEKELNKRIDSNNCLHPDFKNYAYVQRVYYLLSRNIVQTIQQANYHIENRNYWNSINARFMQALGVINQNLTDIRANTYSLINKVEQFNRNINAINTNITNLNNTNKDGFKRISAQLKEYNDSISNQPINIGVDVEVDISTR